MQKLSWLLFDVDNTLLDFSGAAKAALWASFEAHEVECTEEIHAIYQEVNHHHWMAFEQGKIDAVTLRHKRFEVLFQEIGRTELPAKTFSKAFLDNLILKSEAYEGVSSLLEALQKDYHLSIVTNGLKEVQRARLNRLKMSHYFDSIIVSDEIGVAKPHGEYFEAVYDSIPQNPPKEEMLIVGDSIHSDIQGGNDFGIKTCWVSHGRENQSEVQPDFEIHHIDDFPQFLKTNQL